jgi:hypothetical protein
LPVIFKAFPFGGEGWKRFHSGISAGGRPSSAHLNEIPSFCVVVYFFFFIPYFLKKREREREREREAGEKKRE